MSNNFIFSLIIPFFIFFLFFKIFFSLKKIFFLSYIFTPLTTISIIILSLLSVYKNPNQFNFFVTTGLLFSLVGDIFNIKEESDNRHLMYSSIFFILTHLCYLIVFIKGYIFAWYQIILLVAIMIILMTTNFLFKKKLNQFILKAIISLYTIIVSAVLFIAVGNLSYHPTTKAVFIAVGMVLFWLSDLILGVHSFRINLKMEPLWVWGLYAPGQLLIALSCFY